MREIELLVPASSLEVLKIAVIYGADAYILEERLLDFVQKQRISPWKIWQKGLPLRMRIM